MKHIICSLALFSAFLSNYAVAEVTLIKTRTVASASESNDPELQRLEEANDELKLSLLGRNRKLGSSRPANDGLKVTLIRIRK